MPRWTDIVLLLLLILVAAAPAAVDAQGGGRRRYSHDGGLWGSAKDAVEPMLRPACDSMRSRYDGLNDNGRFLAGACVGFGATKLAVGGEFRPGNFGSPRTRRHFCHTPAILLTTTLREFTFDE